MTRQPWLALITSTIAGALIWALSPLITGQKEPWDASGHYFLVGLIVAGCLSGLLTPRPLWALFLGAFIGQVAYMSFFLGSGPMWPIGVGFLLLSSLVFLGAAGLGSMVRKILVHRAATNN